MKQAPKPIVDEWTRWRISSWKHEKCHTGLHVFAKDSTLGDKCYCLREKLTAIRKLDQFIERD